MALKHNAAFQPVADYLMKPCRHSLVKLAFYAEKTIFFSLCVSFIFGMKSTATLVFECVWNAKPDNDTKLLVALFRVNVLSSTLCLPLLGKRHLQFGVGFEQWGRFHELYSVVSLTLGNRSQSQLFLELTVNVDDGWSISSSEGDLWHTGTRRNNKVVKKVCMCARLWSQWQHLFAESFLNSDKLYFQSLLNSHGLLNFSLTQKNDKDHMCHFELIWPPYLQVGFPSRHDKVAST